MEDESKQPIHFSKATNLADLINEGNEFFINMDFKKPAGLEDAAGGFSSDPEDEDEDSDEDVFKNLEATADKLMLASPEYHNFDELALKMIDCVPSGAVKLLIIEEGTGPLVPVDAEVTIHYAAYWEKAKIPFDSTVTMNYGTPLKICLGRGKVLPGLEVGLTMVRGPVARVLLLLAPEATWGQQGAMPRIRSERCLFTVHLYDVRDTQAAVRFNDLPREEQSKYEVTMKTVKSLHSVARDLFTKKRYKKAIKNYEQSMSVLCMSCTTTPDEEESVKKLKGNSYINLAICYYKINRPKIVIYMLDNLDYVIDVDNHCKALFYYGRAYEALGKTEQALVYYKKALKLEPKNVHIGNTLSALDASIRNSAVKEKELWQNAFRSAPNLEKEKKSFDSEPVDEDFQNGVRDMCKDLAGTDEYAKFDLPTGMTKNEVACIKSIAQDFEKLLVLEDGEGKQKKVAIVRKV